MDFAYSGNPTPLRESAFYNENIGGIQRHLPGDENGSTLVIDSEEKFSKVLRAGAISFYFSYWRYEDPFSTSEIRGRDLVWSLRAKKGGLTAAKEVTNLFVNFLEEEGFFNPLIKYSGEVGFDIVIPLEDVQTTSPNDLDFLSKVHRDLTGCASDYILSNSSFGVENNGFELKLKGRMGTCLLTELRWRRGLLLAPMSLHPSSGLVSVPLFPEELNDFSIVEASPKKVQPRKWSMSKFLSERTEYVNSPPVLLEA